MKFFLYRLLPPRPSFPSDITPAEAQLMRQHAQYWHQQLERGSVIVFGPVADPKGSYGIAVLQLASDDDAQVLASGDPVIKAGVGFTFELHLMPQCVTKSHETI